MNRSHFNLMTYTADRIDKESMVGENVDLLFKPVSPKDLLGKIRDMLTR